MPLMSGSHAHEGDGEKEGAKKRRGEEGRRKRTPSRKQKTSKALVKLIQKVSAKERACDAVYHTTDACSDGSSPKRPVA